MGQGVGFGGGGGRGLRRLPMVTVASTVSDSADKAAFEDRMSPTDVSGEPERRIESREPTAGNLWLIDNQNGMIIRCRCQDSSARGMRLRVPAGYGVR